MKIIFNLDLNSWFWQIYDELRRNNEIILPKRELSELKNQSEIDINALVKCVNENKDADFIIDTIGEFPSLIRWENYKIQIPLIKFKSNNINRPYRGLISLFTKVWYCEYYAKPLMKKYNNDNLIYQGMAANPYIFHPLPVKKVYDVFFFGQQYETRKYWLYQIKEFCINKRFKYYFPKGHGGNVPWTYDDINQFYNKSKINISFAPMEHCGRIVNLRTFEICMSGNFQLMEYTPCVEEYFNIDKEIICWKNRKELFEKIQYYIENEDEREKIAKNGYERAKKFHTWSNRFEKIYYLLNENKSKKFSEDYIIKLDNILDKEKIERINLSVLWSIYDIFSKLLKPILKNYGYKIKKELKQKHGIPIIYHKQNSKFLNMVFYHKPNLKDYWFIELHGQIMGVIKIINPKKEIKYEIWEELEKISFLIQNPDSSFPKIGVLTNGFQWLIRDFKEKMWLNEIPNRQKLRSRINLRLMYFFKIRFLFYYRFHKLIYSIYILFITFPRVDLLIKIFYYLPDMNKILLKSKIYKTVRNMNKKGYFSRYLFFFELVILEILEKKDVILDPLSRKVLYIDKNI